MTTPVTAVTVLVAVNALLTVAVVVLLGQRQHWKAEAELPRGGYGDLPSVVHDGFEAQLLPLSPVLEEERAAQRVWCGGCGAPVLPGVWWPTDARHGQGCSAWRIADLERSLADGQRRCRLECSSDEHWGGCSVEVTALLLDDARRQLRGLGA